MKLPLFVILFFFFNDTATTEIYTLSLHDALPIWTDALPGQDLYGFRIWRCALDQTRPKSRSEEHTSELQSHSDLVCRLLLEKKKERQLGMQQVEAYGLISVRIGNELAVRER